MAAESTELSGLSGPSPAGNAPAGPTEPTQTHPAADRGGEDPAAIARGGGPDGSSAAGPAADPADPSDPLAKVRAQFDRAPYPRKPLDAQPNAQALYFHNWATAYYRRNQAFAPTENLTILDVGCGSGFKTQILAIANPTARVVGVDLSPASVELARQRLEHHGLADRTAFRVLAMADLPQLQERFDYINCDELLYLQPDPADGLAAMKAVLKPHGIIRTNLHSFYQRIEYFKAQEAAQMMGLMDDNPGEMEVELLAEVMNALKPNVPLKQRTGWNPEKGKNEELMLMNFLFQRDRGFTVSQLFEFVDRAGLEFVSMTDWQSWNFLDLFQDPEDLPAFLAMSLPGASDRELLHLYDLFAPRHRLLDFWCGHPGQGRDWEPLEDWEPEDWDGAVARLHPQLQTDEFREALGEALLNFRDVNPNRFLPLPWGVNSASGAIALALVPLLDGPKPFAELVAYWKSARPVDPVTLEPTGDEAAAAPIRYLLQEFEKIGYAMVERAA